MAKEAPSSPPDEAKVSPPSATPGRCEGVFIVEADAAFSVAWAPFSAMAQCLTAPPGKRASSAGIRTEEVRLLRPLWFYLPPRIEDPAGEPAELVALKTHGRAIEKAREVWRYHLPRYRKMISNDPSWFSRERIRGDHFRVDFLETSSEDPNDVSSRISGDP
jgi:hypothetical protein